MRKRELCCHAEVEREHRLQVGQVVGVGRFTQYEQTVDVGVDDGLRAWIVFEQGHGIFTVLGFDRLALEFELGALKQQQRAAEIGHGVLEFRILDSVQRLLELRDLVFETGMRLPIAG